MGFSMKPSEASEGGGLLDDADVEWVGLEFTHFAYGGDTERPVLAISMAVDGVDDSVVQYFSVGSAEMWAPSDDGKTLEFIGEPKKDGSTPNINKSTNMMILMESLVKAGFPEDKLDEDCTLLAGLKCHMVRVAAPVRKGLKNNFASNSDRPQTNLVVESINQLPWEKKGVAKGKATTAAPVKGKKAEVVEEEAQDDDIQTRAIEVVLEILESNPKGIDKKKLASSVFMKVKTDPNRKEISELIFSDEFLSDGPWTFDKGVVKA